MLRVRCCHIFVECQLHYVRYVQRAVENDSVATDTVGIAKPVSNATDIGLFIAKMQRNYIGSQIRYILMHKTVTRWRCDVGQYC